MNIEPSLYDCGIAHCTLRTSNTKSRLSNDYDRRFDEGLTLKKSAQLSLYGENLTLIN